MHIQEEVELCMKVLPIYMLCNDDGKVNMSFLVWPYMPNALLLSCLGVTQTFPFVGECKAY